MKTLSIVVPVYFNELNLPETIPALLALGNSLPAYRLELVFVDDGSKDRSLAVLLDFQQRNPGQIKIVKLARNFGAMMAVQAGLAQAGGDCVAVTSADLQDPPELILEMVQYWEQGIKAVFATRAQREESFSQRLFSNTYYRLLRAFAIPDYPSGGFDMMLVDRQVVDEINKIHEKNTNLMTLTYWLGYQSVSIPYVRRARTKGRSRWTLTKKIKLFIDTFISFSYFPIRLLTVTGFLFALGAIIYGGVIVVAWGLNDISVKGWVPMMLILTLASGLQMIMLGVLGEYLWRVLDETRKRPPYVIDQVYETRIQEEIRE